MVRPWSAIVRIKGVDERWIFEDLKPRDPLKPRDSLDDSEVER